MQEKEIDRDREGGVRLRDYDTHLETLKREKERDRERERE